MRARHAAALAFCFAVPLVSVAFAQPTNPGAPAPPGSAAPPATSAPPAETTAAPPPPPPTSAPPPPAASAPPPPAASAPVAAPPKAEEKPPASTRPAQHTFAPELGLGWSTRLGGTNMSDTGLDRRTALGMHLGLYYGPNRTVAFGLQYDHSAGGRERNTGRISQALTIDRSVHALLAEVRVHPLNRDSGRIFVSLLLGGSYENSTAQGTYGAYNGGAVADVRTAKCSGSGDPSLALGAGVGADYELGEGFAFVARGAFLGHRLSSDYIQGEGCAFPGAGSIPTLQAHIGFAYRIDLDRANKR